MLRQVFKEQLDNADERKSEAFPSVASARAKLISEISIAIEAEKQFIAGASVPDEEKANAYKMLGALLNAVKDGNEELIDALICGYNYFVLFYKCVSDGIASLIEMLAEYEETL